MTEASEYYEAINYVYVNGLFLGKTESFFGIDDLMTRGMFVTVLGRLADVDIEEYTGRSFTDVDPEMYYAPYIEWASANNIVLGIGDGMFDPESNVTVEQAAAIIARYARVSDNYSSPDADLSGYADFDQIDEWALSDMSWATARGIYTGRNGYLYPLAAASRGVVASMIYMIAK